MTLTAAQRRVLAVLAAVGLGGVFTVSAVAGGDDPARLAHAREHVALCQVQRDTAVTADEVGRAAQCLADWGRVVKALEPTPPPAPTPEPEPTPGPEKFPNASSVGVPAGWTPKTVYGSDLTIRSGRVVEDTQVNGDIYIQVPNVTLRRVEVLSGRIHLSPVACRGAKTNVGMVYPVIEDTTVRAFAATTDRDPPSIGDGGYVARRVAILDTPEGFRDGGRSDGCGPVVIEDSYARVWSPDRCADWHGDSLQGYDGVPLTVTHTTLDLVEDGACPGNAPFFVPHSQGNTTVTVNGLLVRGGGFPFRLGVPATVRGLRIADGSWGYGPLNVKCSVVSSWEASIVRTDVDNTVTSTVRALPCSTEDGR